MTHFHISQSWATARDFDASKSLDYVPYTSCPAKTLRTSDLAWIQCSPLTSSSAVHSTWILPERHPLKKLAATATDDVKGTWHILDQVSVCIRHTTGVRQSLNPQFPFPNFIGPKVNMDDIQRRGMSCGRRRRLRMRHKKREWRMTTWRKTETT